MQLDHKPRRASTPPPVNRADKILSIAALLVLGAYFGAVLFYALT